MERYTIKTIDYHYYYELSTIMNEYYREGWKVIQIFDIGSSGDSEKMHKATVLFEKI